MIRNWTCQLDYILSLLSQYIWPQLVAWTRSLSAKGTYPSVFAAFTSHYKQGSTFSKLPARPRTVVLSRPSSLPKSSPHNLSKTSWHASMSTEGSVFESQNHLQRKTPRSPKVSRGLGIQQCQLRVFSRRSPRRPKPRAKDTDIRKIHQSMV